jgi:hypothetical protein
VTPALLEPDGRLLMVEPRTGINLGVVELLVVAEPDGRLLVADYRM